MSNQYKSLNEELVDGMNNVYSHLCAQMAAPFYLLSNIFLGAGKQSMNTTGLFSNKASIESERFVIKSSEMPPEVYIFLDQKRNANELQDYLIKLVEQDLKKAAKKENEEFQTLLDSLRNELIGEINLLKKELAKRPAAAKKKKAKPSTSEKKAKDLKEGQLLKSDKVTGTIEEAIDVNF